MYATIRHSYVKDTVFRRFGDAQARHVIQVIVKNPDTPEWRPCSVPTAFKKLQNAEVRAVQTPATLCKRCAIARNAMRRRLLRACSKQTPRLGVSTAMEI